MMRRKAHRASMRLSTRNIASAGASPNSLDDTLTKMETWMEIFHVINGRLIRVALDISHLNMAYLIFETRLTVKWCHDFDF
jgi:hypothetical protein